LEQCESIWEVFLLFRVENNSKITSSFAKIDLDFFPLEPGKDCLEFQYTYGDKIAYRYSLRFQQVPFSKSLAQLENKAKSLKNLNFKIWKQILKEHKNIVKMSRNLSFLDITRFLLVFRIWKILAKKNQKSCKLKIAWLQMNPKFKKKKKKATPILNL
jgi:hypothetical protein